MIDDRHPHTCPARYLDLGADCDLRHLPADAPEGAEPDTDVDGMAEELAAEIADALTARALGYVRPGISLDPGETSRDGARWAGMLRGAAILRAAAVAVSTWTPDDYRAMADADGLVPDVAEYGPADSRERQRELLDVWGGWRATAIWHARLTASREDLRNGDDMVLAAGFRGWPGDLAADYDGSDERFSLSPSGRWADALPPVYAAGADADRERIGAPRVARWR